MTTHSEWLEKIIAKYSGTLTSAECETLNKHILFCYECAQVAKEYEELAICLQPLKENMSTTQLPPRMLALKEKVAQTAQKKTQDWLIEETCALSQESFETQEQGARVLENGFGKIGSSRNLDDKQTMMLSLALVEYSTRPLVIQDGERSDHFGPAQSSTPSPLFQPVTLKDQKIQLAKTLHFKQYGEAQEGINEVEKVFCNKSEESQLDTKKSMMDKVGLILSSLVLSSLVLANLLFLPLNITLVFHIFPLLTTFLPVLLILFFMMYLRSLDTEQVRRYSDAGRAYADLGRKCLKRSVVER